MDEITLKIAQIEKVRDSIVRYLGKALDCFEEMQVDAIRHTVSEYFRYLTGDTQPVDLEKPCEITKPHIVVEVLGGCVTDVTCETHDFTYAVKDYDNDPDLDDKDA